MTRRSEEPEDAKNEDTEYDNLSNLYVFRFSFPMLSSRGSTKKTRNSRFPFQISGGITLLLGLSILSTDTKKYSLLAASGKHRPVDRGKMDFRRADIPPPKDSIDGARSMPKSSKPTTPDSAKKCFRWPVADSLDSDSDVTAFLRQSSSSS